jgi:hypothetical protein
MVRSKYVTLTLFVVIVGILAGVYCFQSEGKKIKKQFKLLSKRASKDHDENNFTMARKARDISKLFAEQCELRAHITSISGSHTRQEISGLAARARLPFSRLSVRFYDLHIEFSEKKTARVTVTAQASGTLRQGELVEDTLELECSLQKHDDKWLFTGIEVVEVLEK